jgi:hypothetical protein
MIELVTNAFTGANLGNVLTICQVFFGYIILCLAMPAICLHKFCAGRPLAIRLVYYQVAGMIYITLFGFALAFLNVYNTASVWLTHILLPLVLSAAFLYRKQFVAKIKGIALVSRGISKGDYTFLRVRTRIAQSVTKFFKAVYKNYLKGHLLTYVTWIFFGLFLLCFYGYFRLHYLNYSCSDDSTHLYWVRCLLLGNPFPAGMYPHTEHFLCACICALLGLTPTRAYLVMNILTNFLIYSMGYIFLRQVVKSRAAAIASVGICLTTNLLQIATYNRLVYSVPMEFAVFALFVCFMSLVLYLREHDRFFLILFGAGLALSFHIHFYVCIFALFLLVAFAVVYIIPALRARIFHKIVLVAILSLVLSIVPFGVGYLCGYQFEQSISWALNIMGVETQDSESTDVDIAISEIEEEEEEYEGLSPEQIEFNENVADIHDLDTYAYAVAWALAKCNIVDSIEMGSVFAYLLLFDVIYGVLGLLISLIMRKKDAVFWFQLVLAFVLSWIVGVVLAAVYLLGLPEIISIGRVIVFVGLWTITIVAVPFEAVARIIHHIPLKTERIDSALAVCVLVALFANLELGAYTRDADDISFSYVTEEADITLCVDLIENYEQNTWTVISPVSDLSTIRFSGYHFEITELLFNIEQGETEFYIPTQYIFVYTETGIPDMGTGRYVNGSDWEEKRTPVSAELASEGFDELTAYGFEMGSHRAYYEFRTALMSRMYYWMQKICMVYPAETSVYYQDDAVTIYRIKQDPYFLLNLALNYDDLIQEDLESEASNEQSNE